MIDEEAGRDWTLWRELSDQLSDYRDRHNPWLKTRHQPDDLPDIDLRLFDIVGQIQQGSKRTFGRIMPAIIANRDALRPEVRRLLAAELQRHAAKEIKQAEAEAARIVARARRWGEFAEALGDPRDVTPEVRSLTSEQSMELKAATR